MSPKQLVVLIGSLFLLGACETTSPDWHYPIGERPGYLFTSRIITARYGDLPITLYLPHRPTQSPSPIVIFNHGRPFHRLAVEAYTLSESHLLVGILNSNGIAVAVPVRRGYFFAPGNDGEGVRCDDASAGDFGLAGRSAAKDISDAIRYVESFPTIDKEKIVVGGISVGGFASVFLLSQLDQKVRAVFSINGGHCGRSGSAIGGLHALKSLYRKLGQQTRTPVAFFYGEQDDVVPERSAKELYVGFCSGRGDTCNDTVLIKKIEGVGHNLWNMLQSIEDELLDFIRKNI